MTNQTIDTTNQTISYGRYLVQRYSIIGAPTWIETRVLEPYAGHSSLTHIDGVTWGYLTTRKLTAELDALPAWSAERSVRVKLFFAELKDLERDIIEAVF